ncbi:helix-turn-helix domain-containing protein [Streptomyces sp. 3214.6]|uniref:helix-turn-helix domain-containing protein n=1 Tax=Streptomyces sp. 3214.6 TaxID=1882757 RepID=UPI00090BBF1C|nr:helix-turn-helix domain-containing protein [Streptomyces sp. 3214.6]SHI08893.1 Helix-turn-helix domain-containing protein [Streptomyces sp. 3214.6]
MTKNPGVAVGRELDAGQAGTGKGSDEVAVLDQIPDGPRRALVAQLRALREASGLTVPELVQRLEQRGVALTASRLSNFLSGHEVPSRAQVTALHRVCEAAAGTERDPDAVQETRRLLYAVLDAERTTKPLRAREFDLEELREQLERVRVHTATELGVLRDELDRERALRRQAEDQLTVLIAAADDHAREIGETTAERDVARGRIAELEDQIRQHEALLRLHEKEARHLRAMAQETAQEIARYDSPVLKTPSPETTANATDVPNTPNAPNMRDARGGLEVQEVDVLKVVAAVERLRDEDRDHEADQVLSDICEAEPDLLPVLWQAFRAGHRRLDAERLLVEAAQCCNGITLYRLWRTRTFLGTRHVGLFPLHTDHLMTAIGNHAPLDVLERFIKACRERDDQQGLRLLALNCTPLPVGEVLKLREVGLPTRPFLFWPWQALLKAVARTTAFSRTR